jgi:hypothetical protein
LQEQGILAAREAAVNIFARLINTAAAAEVEPEDIAVLEALAETLVVMVHLALEAAAAVVVRLLVVIQLPQVVVVE